MNTLGRDNRDSFPAERTTQCRERLYQRFFNRGKRGGNVKFTAAKSGNAKNRSVNTSNQKNNTGKKKKTIRNVHKKK